MPEFHEQPHETFLHSVVSTALGKRLTHTTGLAHRHFAVGAGGWFSSRCIIVAYYRCIIAAKRPRLQRRTASNSLKTRKTAFCNWFGRSLKRCPTCQSPHLTDGAAASQRMALTRSRRTQSTSLVAGLAAEVPRHCDSGQEGITPGWSAIRKLGSRAGRKILITRTTGPLWSDGGVQKSSARVYPFGLIQSQAAESASSKISEFSRKVRKSSARADDLPITSV